MPAVDFTRLASLGPLRKCYRLVWRLFGVNVAMVHPEGHPTRRLGGPRTVSPFCGKMHRLFPGSLRICQECDRRHLEEARRRGEIFRYRCFVGLTEYYIPIHLDGEILAFLQCGQILDGPPGPAEWARARRALAARQIDPAPLESAFFRVRVIPPRDQEDLAALLELFGDYIARLHQQLSLLEEDWASQIVGRARSYISSHLGEDLPLGDIAQAACTSRRNLTRVFRRETGRTVGQFIRESRVARACQRLAATQETCARIAYSCGFGSVQQFNRVFRRLKGTTPSAWRRERGSRPRPLSQSANLLPPP